MKTKKMKQIVEGKKGKRNEEELKKKKQILLKILFNTSDWLSQIPWA